ncbi:hypothetical protein TB1_001320 [Malus domestica]
MDIFKSIDPVEKCLRDAKMDITSVHDVVVSGGSSRIPKMQQLLQEVFKGKELCKGINPDEAVAYGTGVHAAVLCGNGTGKLQDFTLLDATPLTSGVETSGKHVMGVVIPRSTRVPMEKKTTLVTICDNQRAITFPIHEGESKTTLNNHYLGEFKLHDIPPAPRMFLNSTSALKLMQMVFWLSLLRTRPPAKKEIKGLQSTVTEEILKELRS